VLCALVVALAFDALARSDTVILRPKLPPGQSPSLSGAQPKAGGLATLKKIGIKTILNLRGEDEHTRAEGGRSSNRWTRYYNVSCPNSPRPKDKEFSRRSRFINAAQNQPVLSTAAW